LGEYYSSATNPNPHRNGNTFSERNSDHDCQSGSDFSDCVPISDVCISGAEHDTQQVGTIDLNRPRQFDEPPLLETEYDHDGLSRRSRNARTLS